MALVLNNVCGVQLAARFQEIPEVPNGLYQTDKVWIPHAAPPPVQDCCFLEADTCTGQAQMDRSPAVSALGLADLQQTNWCRILRSSPQKILRTAHNLKH